MVLKKVEDKEYLNYSDVLIKPAGLTSLKSRNEVNLIRKFPKFECVPIIVANMATVGTFEMAKSVQESGVLVALHKFYSAEEIIVEYGEGLGHNHFISIGQSEEDLDKLDKIYTLFNRRNIMVDVANGYREDFFKFLKKVRERYPDAFIAAGNVCTPEILSEYKHAGMDAVKIGIGPGGQCRTRETAGVGVPQLTAVLDCSEEAKRLGLFTIADGGVNEYADFAKGFCAGADFVMAGSFFGGHDECDNYELVNKDGRQYMTLYGMSSKHAQRKHYGKVENYRSSEGRVSLVPYRGPVETTVQEILGCIRSTCTYADSHNIEDLYRKTEFIKVSDTINRKYESTTIGL